MRSVAVIREDRHMVNRHPWRTCPTLTSLRGSRPILAAAALLSLLGGFIGAAMIDQQPSRWIRAETDPAEQGQQVGVQATLERDSEVRPGREQSLPTAADLLSPEPLMSPVRSLGPGRVDSSVLRAALNGAASYPADGNDIERWMDRP
jgi:hypothetical protein